MKQWSTACPDWSRRIIAGEPLIPFPPLFPDEAEDAMAYFHALHIVDAPGSPMIGEVTRPWIDDFAKAVFGAYDRETGRQLIRHFFLCVSKKNAKSTLAAAIMLTALLRNWRNSAEFIILAPTIEIANNSFWPARDMVRVDDELSNLLHVQENLRMITHRNTKAVLKVVAADNDTVGGKKASGILIDELWLLGKRANAENMLREATGGLASRPEGFVIYLSTQSDVPPSGIFLQKLDEFRAIRDGKISDPKSLPVLYEFPEHILKAEGFRDPANFYITNPNLGASVDEEFLIDEKNKAERNGEASFRGFAAKHLNVEIGIALRSDGWAGARVWDRGIEAGLDLDQLLERSEVVTVGIDGGGLDDLLGIAVIGRERITQRWLLWTHACMSSEAEERRKANTEFYAKFIADGDLTRVEYLPLDLDLIVALVKRIQDAGLLATVGVDKMGIGGIVDALATIDVTNDSGVLWGIPQGIALMGAIKTVERKLADGTFRHGGQRMMDWCVGNAKVVLTPTAMRLARDESGTGKIDPLAAAFDAAHLMGLNPSVSGSIYDDDIAYQKAFGRQQVEGTGDGFCDECRRPLALCQCPWSPQIIADVTHPMFAEHKRRYEQWQAKQHDE